MKRLFILFATLLVAGCTTVQPKGQIPTIGSKNPSALTKAKNTAIQLGSKFKAYPYEHDHLDNINHSETEPVVVPFFKVNF